MEFLILLVLILINGLFAMSEIAIVSSRKARLQQRAEAGSSGARMALKLADDPGKMLSTVQVGITTIGILSGAFGENAIAERLITVFNDYPLLAPYAKGLATVVMVVVITFFSVVLGELVPKRLALLNPESVATTIARPMDLLSRLAHPLVALFSIASSALLHLLGARRPDEPPVTEEEIKVMLQQGTDAGVFEHSEQAMVGNVFRLDDLRVTAIMTRRRDITFLDLEDSDAENLATLSEGRYQTLPVCRGGLDDVVGLLDAKDFLGRTLKGDKPSLADVVHKALYVPETISPNQLLTTLRRHRSYVALVVDEYGNLEGMVTLTDLLEAIVGDLPDFESEGDDIVRREDGSLLLDGTLPLDRISDLLELASPLDDDGGEFHTLGGFVMAELGSVPGVGEHFLHRGWRFEVVDMDHTRVDRVLVSRSETLEASEPRNA